jgi:gliding motility-associated lipoprotein GldD
MNCQKKIRNRFYKSQIANKSNTLISGLVSTLILLLLLFIIACGGSDYVPKPRGYFRINFPEKQYKVFDSVCPYTFEYPVYARIVPDPDPSAEKYWINMEFPQFHGKLYISYKVVKNNLFQYFEDARNFVTKHIPKADDIVPIAVNNDSNRVWGLVYDIEGIGVASSYQFCVTDSLHHFLRGALYFDVVPNNDSLAPVLDFVEKDIDHMISTLKWKKPDR